MMSFESEFNHSNYANQQNHYQQKPPYQSNQNNQNQQADWKNKPLPDTKFYKPFACIANKEVPAVIGQKINALIHELEAFQYTVRTDGNEELGDMILNTSRQYELYLPWKGFNGKESKFAFSSPESLSLVKQLQPGYDKLKPAIHAFLSRSLRMVLGQNVKSPALFVLCWSEDGAETSTEKTFKTGNISIAIAAASALKIPVFNFGKSNAEQRFKNYIGMNANVQTQQTSPQEIF